jgi:Holliday junction resolvase-like predicted endonuclease
MAIKIKNKAYIGNIGEEVTKNSLLANDFSVFTRNFRTKHGEIDIVATKNKSLYFVEVKSKGVNSVLGKQTQNNNLRLMDSGKTNDLVYNRISKNKILKVKKAAEEFIDKNRHDPKVSQSETLFLGISVVLINDIDKKASLKIQFMPI